MKSDVKVCKRCVMDNINTDITFDEKGYCNYCTDALERKESVWHNNKEGKKELDKLIQKIKEENKDKKYDCVLGLSGGIDSCYTAYLLKQYGLRILAVHIDGGWNTEISEKNIKMLCEKLDLELHTIKVDYKEMYDLQRAYFLSEVINQDIPQDHIFFSELYRYALKNGIRHFISGGNFSSESILPTCWGFNAMDGKNLKDIHKKFGKIQLKRVKPLSFFEVYIKMPYINKLKKIRPLNYIDYNKEEAIKELNEKFDFQYYGGKHCESIFTRLYQGYILPKKFGINKSKAHYSSLIVANQITRKKALEEIEKNDYVDNQKLLENDIKVFIDRIGITRKEFDQIINNGIRINHLNFKNQNRLFKFFKVLRNLLVKNK